MRKQAQGLKEFLDKGNLANFPSQKMSWSPHSLISIAIKLGGDSHSTWLLGACDQSFCEVFDLQLG